MNLSENFTLVEMTVNKAGLKNDPSPEQLKNMTFVCENILEVIRAWARTKKPNAVVTVTSGFRNPQVNKNAGGAANSQHLQGIAADIKIAGISNCDLWHFIVSSESGIDFDQCIAELHNEQNPSAGWVHVSSKREGKNRNQKLSFLGKGKYVTGYKYA